MVDNRCVRSERPMQPDATSGRQASVAPDPSVQPLFRIRTFRSAVNGNFLTRLGIGGIPFLFPLLYQIGLGLTDRKSTRLNSSHLGISYAVFCLKKKKNTRT